MTTWGELPAYLAGPGDGGPWPGVVAGGFALLLAPDHGFAASSVNYGMVPKDPETFLAGGAPAASGVPWSPPSIVEHRCGPDPRWAHGTP